MDISAIGSMYLKSSTPGGPSDSQSLGSGSAASFELMLKAAAKAEAEAAQVSPFETKEQAGRAAPVQAVGRPLGAAANSGARDAAHAAPAAQIDRTTKLYEQCRALESFVVKNLMEGLRKTVQKSGFMDGGFAGEMYEDMLYDEYATKLSKTAGFGLADLAYLELSGRRGSS